MKEYNRTCAEVDLEAIRHNIREVKGGIKENTKIMAIVKADAYGHGAKQVTQALDSLVDAYGVAIAEEALQLRSYGVDKMILILGYIDPEWFGDLICNDISLTIFDFDTARLLSQVACGIGKNARIHIKVDTGMSRIGFLPEKENVKAVKQIALLPGIEIEGIFTHFARADETSVNPIKEPYQKFIQFVNLIKDEGVQIPICHASNSAAIIRFPEANLDMVRSGITTYGIYPSDEVEREHFHYLPAMQWKTSISYVKEVPPGTEISYGGTYTTTRRTRVATVPIGYADGMKRSASNIGKVLVCGEYAPILGRICMDQFMIDVTEIEEAKRGSKVIIFGKDGDKEITVEEAAAWSESFSYEYLCSITGRVPRKYKGIE